MKTYRTPLIIVAAIGIIGLLFFWNRFFPPSSVKTVELSDPTALPGVQTGAAPWAAETAHLKDRLQAIGLPALSNEGSALHMHEHLDIFINGKSVPVPAGIGINQQAGFISPIHTHDTSGVIHVESPTVDTFTLGQFFDVWGVRLTATCMGGYCADDTHKLTLYVNGQPATGSPRTLALEAHQEIALVYGSASDTPPTIPSAYAFPAGE